MKKVFLMVCFVATTVFGYENQKMRTLQVGWDGIVKTSFQNLFQIRFNRFDMSIDDLELQLTSDPNIVRWKVKDADKFPPVSIVELEFSDNKIASPVFKKRL
jgi:hypothetical protein